MKRWITRILICTILSAISTIAVAWACAWLSMPTYAGWEWVDRSGIESDSNSIYLQGMGERGLASIWESPGFRETNFHEVDAWLVRNDELDIEAFIAQVVASTKDTFESQSNLHHVFASQFPRRVRRIDSGWPFLALHGSVAQHPSIAGRDRSMCIEVTRPWWRSYASALPLSPNWGGFAGNTIIYAGVIGLLWWVAVRLRVRQALIFVLRASPRTSARRSIARAAACILLGAVTTIGIAWLIAWFAVPNRRGAWMSDVQRRTAGEVWNVSRVEATGDVLVSSYRYRDDSIGDILTAPPPEEIVPAWSLAGDGSLHPTHDSFFDMHLVEGLGWPILAMQSVYEPTALAAATVQVRVRIGTSIPRMTDMSGARINKTLPVIPIWPGFIFNAMAFAFVYWLMLVAPRMVRRAVRLKRARCPQRGYDLRYHHTPRGATSGGGHSSHTERGGTGGCPECGWRRSD